MPGFCIYQPAIRRPALKNTPGVDLASKSIEERPSRWPTYQESKERCPRRTECAL
jgi:hypothetical protein